MRTIALFLSTLLVLVFQSSGDVNAGEPSVSQEELVKRTQELFDAVVTGNKEPWKKYYADDCLFHDEKGRGLDKSKLVADIEPLFDGYSCTIKVVKPESRITANFAVLSYDTDETEIIFGQELHARYHGTDTWRLRDGQWRIIAAQTMRYYEDPAIGQAKVEKFPTYAGTYALGPERKTVVTVENGHLFMERKGKKIELFLESGNLFFRKGVEGRILFHGNENGKVDSMIDRRNNEDVAWKKTN